MPMKVKEDDFRLKKFRLLPNGGLSIVYHYSIITEEQIFDSEHTIKQEIVPHPDLTNLVRGLNDYIAQVFGYGEMDDEQYEAISATIESKGFSIAGSEELTSVILIGAKSAGMFLVNLNTHPILLQGNQYGFESELSDLLDSIKDETYKYIFEDHFAQTKLLFADIVEA